MSRQLQNKELINTRLATTYGGWIYCTNCNENIGYLCYVTYDRLKLQYECNCGSKGKILLDFIDSKAEDRKDESLITIKNRLCCPHDESPLLTILNKKISVCDFEITCKECGSTYKGKQLT